MAMAARTAMAMVVHTPPERIPSHMSAVCGHNKNKDRKKIAQKKKLDGM